MDDSEIIKAWKFGYSKQYIAKDYMKQANKKLKNLINSKKITEKEALAYVEPIIYQYQTSLLMGGNK